MVHPDHSITKTLQQAVQNRVCGNPPLTNLLLATARHAVYLHYRIFCSTAHEVALVNKLRQLALFSTWISEVGAPDNSPWRAAGWQH